MRVVGSPVELSASTDNRSEPSDRESKWARSEVTLSCRLEKAIVRDDRSGGSVESRGVTDLRSRLRIPTVSYVGNIQTVIIINL
jgi:hypothetical protein